MTIIIVDYNAGNLKSIENILDTLGAEYKVSDDKDDILNAEKIIFPGQGHFKQAIENLTKKNLIEVIKTAIEKGIPFLGICLGLQILFERSEEAHDVEGLGVLKGSVVKFQSCKTPQIGWNKIETTANNSYLEDDYFYFVNSYYVKPTDEGVISSQTCYNVEFCSSIEHNNLVAVQFHPEKSAEAGKKFFAKWLNGG